MYALAGAFPLLLFAVFGPMIRKHTPQGFVLTEWVRQRYGITAGLVFSACTVLTIYLFSVGELSSVQAAVTTMTGMDGLPALLVESLFTATYTSFGGFFVSFFTDNIQAPMFIILLIIAMISIGVTVPIDHSLVGPSGLLKANPVGWKLVYILPVAILFNDSFMASFWMRTFAARSDKDLWIGCSIAAVGAFVICSAVGVTGLFAVWSGLLDPASETFYEDSSLAFYYVLLQMPRWIHGFVLVFAVCLSTCTFDSLVSAMASTISNDWFRNRVRLIWVRLIVFAMMAPIIIVALRAPNVLNIWLITDILAASIVPSIFMGLSKYMWWITGVEIITSLVGGLLTTFIFGTIYYGNADAGGGLLLLENGLYVNDWGAFGAFVAAPVGCVIGMFVGLVFRTIVMWFMTGRFGAAFDKDLPHWDHRFWAKWNSEIPWYERLPQWARPDLCRKLDYILFIQTKGEPHPPWYEGKPDWCRRLDKFVFPEQVDGNNASSRGTSLKDKSELNVVKVEEHSA